jgi:hypothetical protein
MQRRMSTVVSHGSYNDTGGELGSASEVLVGRAGDKITLPLRSIARESNTEASDSFAVAVSVIRSSVPVTRRQFEFDTCGC